MGPLKPKPVNPKTLIKPVPGVIKPKKIGKSGNTTGYMTAYDSISRPNRKTKPVMPRRGGY